MTASKLDLLQGTLDLMVLQTLTAMGPLHGYGIARRIEHVSGDKVFLNQGTIYASLVRLQQRGWISSEWGVSSNNRKAKFYSITKRGRKQLSEDAVNWQRLASVMSRVLAMQEDLTIGRKEVGDQGRQADPEVDVCPIGKVAGNTRRDLFLVELLHQAAFRIDGATRTTRLTKMPGVTIDSGSRAPSSTVSRTCTTAQLAALAMIGPKFRALLR